VLHKQDRIYLQRERERKLKLPKVYLVKGDSLFERGRKFGLAVNDANIGNRATRREAIKKAIKEERAKRAA
jgi:hypothetical protein